MTNTFKHKLLLGTALVAVGAFASGAAFAAAVVPATGNTDITGADTWNTNSGQGAVDANLTYTNGGVRSLTITDSAADRTANLGSITISNTGGTNTLTLGDGTDNNIDLTINGNISGDVDGTANDLNIVVNANGAGTGDDAFAFIFKGTTLNLGSGTITLNDDDTNNQGDATVTISGTGAQAITGEIKGDSAGEGQIFITNTGGTVTFNSSVGGGTNVGAISIGGASGTTSTVVFNGTVGTVNTSNETGIITVGQTDGGAATATFKNTVTGTQGIVLGTGAGVNSAHIVNFDSTTQGFTVTGAISGGHSGDTNTVNVLGGKTIIFATGMGTEIDALNITGSGTELDANAAVQAGTITIGSGATLDAGANVTGAVSLGGTLNVTGAADLSGNINGSSAGTGVLDIDAATNILNSVGLTTTISSVDVASGITLTVNPTGNMTFATANGINLNDDGLDNGTNTILAFTTANGEVHTVNSAITTTTNKEGQISVTDSTATVDFNGNVGTSSKALQTFTFENAGGNANIVTASGNWYVDNTLLDAADILRFDGTTAQVVSGTINAHGANEGNLFVGNTGTKSNVTFNSAVGTTALNSFTVVEGSTAIFGGTAGTTSHDFDNNLTVDGTLRINQGITLNADNYVVGTAKGVVEFVIGTTTAGVDQSATLVINDTVNWDDYDGTTANGASTLLKQGTGVILNGQDFRIIDGAGAIGTIDVAGEIVADEYALFNFKAYDGATKTVGGSNNTDVVVEATFADTGAVTINRNNADAATGLLNVTVAEYAADTDGVNELGLVYDNVTRATNAQIDERLEAIQPTVDGGNIVAATSVANITSNIIQLASTDAEGSGIAAGNISNGLRAWAQVFGQTGQQDDRDGIDGYDVDTYGFAVGLDTQALADQMVIGLAFSYADTEVDSDNANNTTTEIDTYQVTLYGTYNIDEATYVSGQLGYAFGDNSTRRNDLGGVASVDANGDFDSNQFIARLEAGRAYEVGTITTLTPKVLVNYNYYDADSYRETGAGGAGLSVDQDTNHILEVGAGVDADWMFQQADGSYVKPQLRAGVRYDLADDEVEATSSFIGGGNAFKTEGFDPQQFALDVGAGVTYFSTTNWELTANYDYEWKEDYDSHAGFLRAAYKF